MSAISGPGEQQSLTDALQAAAADVGAAGVLDDRVLPAAQTCSQDDCERPAGADGLCPPCRREYDGHAIGNHGGRL